MTVNLLTEIFWFEVTLYSRAITLILIANIGYLGVVSVIALKALSDSML